MNTPARLVARVVYLPRERGEVADSKFVSIIKFVGTTTVPKFNHG